MFNTLKPGKLHTAPCGTGHMSHSVVWNCCTVWAVQWSAFLAHNSLIHSAPSLTMHRTRRKLCHTYSSACLQHTVTEMHTPTGYLCGLKANKLWRQYLSRLLSKFTSGMYMYLIRTLHSVHGALRNSGTVPSFTDAFVILRSMWLQYGSAGH